MCARCRAQAALHHTVWMYRFPAPGIFFSPRRALQRIFIYDAFIMRHANFSR
jgi:hypothetical protein